MSRSRIFLRSVLRLTPEQVGGPDLVAAGRRQRRRQQRILDLAQDAVIEAGRRQLVAEAREIARQMALDRGREPVLGARLFVGRRHRRLRQLGVDHRGRDGLLRIERGEPAGEVFQLAHVARPAIALEPLERRLVDLLRRQALALDHG